MISNDVETEKNKTFFAYYHVRPVTLQLVVRIDINHIAAFTKNHNNNSIVIKHHIVVCGWKLVCVCVCLF